MQKIFKNNFADFLTVLLIFLMITGWFFSGWPRIWQDPPVPPEIKKVYAATCGTNGALDGTTCTYTTAGADTFTSPAGVTSVDVECWAGGGAGGGNNTATDGGGGGGGGAYSAATVSINAETLYNVVVGAGGVGGVSDGTAGGDSYFDAGADITAKGGTGGKAPDGGAGGVAGAGGTGSTGSPTYDGGAGGTGADAPFGAGGGGGGGAGDAANGGAGGAGANKATGAGGTAGTNGGGAGGAGGNYGYDGISGTAPGGAGGGSGDGTQTGGAGAAGKCILTWSTGAVVSVTLDRENFAYGKVPNNTASSTLSLWSGAGITATNGDVVANFHIYGANSSGSGSGWTLAADNTGNNYMHKFCDDTELDCSSPLTNYTALTTSPVLLEASVAISGTVAFQLQITTPVAPTDVSMQSAVVTVQASEP